MNKFELRVPDTRTLRKLDQLAKIHRRSRNEEILAAIDQWVHDSPLFSSLEKK